MTTATTGSILAKMVDDQRGEVEATNQGEEEMCEVEPAVGAGSHQGVLVNPTETLVPEIRVVSEETQQQTRRDCHHINFRHPRAGRITSPASTVSTDIEKNWSTAATGRTDPRMTTGKEMTPIGRVTTSMMDRAGSTPPELTDTAVEPNR